MAYKKDIKPWLKDNGYTWEDMDNIWKDCCEVNRTCKLLSEAGRNWSDLTIHQIKQLPTLKEDTIKKLKEKEEAEAKQAKLNEEAKKEKEYYEENFESIMIDKIENKEKLTEEEISRLVYDYGYKTYNGDNRRWCRTVTTICALGNRLFRIIWEEGLTENQDNSFLNQPVEVFEIEELKIAREIEYLTREKYEEALIEQDYNLINVNDISTLNIKHNIHKIDIVLNTIRELLDDESTVGNSKEINLSIKCMQELANDILNKYKEAITNSK